MSSKLDVGNIRDTIDSSHNTDSIRWPEDRKFAVCLTHDVDRVRKSYQYFTDIFKNKQKNSLKLFNKDFKEPYWQFKTIMDLEESFKVKSTFFFLNESLPFNLFNPSSWKLSQGRYDINSKRLKRIIKELDEHGWEIGLHGSIRSYNNPRLLLREKKILENIIGHNVLGIRQHYLNLQIPLTWKMHQLLGLKYDASFGFKNKVGYKNKIRFPFSPFGDKFLVIPLPLMDSFLFSQYPNYEDALASVIKLVDEVESTGGLLTVLWHQISFSADDFPNHTKIYRMLIEECQRRNAWFGTCREIYNHTIMSKSHG